MAGVPTTSRWDDTADGFVGVFMVEMPPGWWLPEGLTLTANGTAPVQLIGPTGTSYFVYRLSGYAPPRTRVEKLAKIVNEQLGPMAKEELDYFVDTLVRPTASPSTINR